MKHVLLTGEKGIGKSTLVQRVVSLLGVEPGGFITRFDDRSRESKRLLIGDGRDMREVVQVSSGEPPRVFNDVFESYGSELVTRSAGFVLMDECGRFEARAEKFTACVRQRLDGDVPVLCVVQRVDKPCWLNELLTHPNAWVVEVTASNRDELVDELVRHFEREGIAK